MAPGQHKPNEKMIGVWLDIELIAKLERACKKAGMTKVAYIAGLITDATADIELTEEDKQFIIDFYAKQK
jgi:hypothetical protein